MTLSINEIQRLLEGASIAPKKSLGQNFVIRVLDMTTVINPEGEPLTTILVLKSTKEFIEQQIAAQNKRETDTVLTPA